LEKGLSIISLAAEAEISHSHLHYLETGKTLPTLKTLLKLADALEVEMKDFFK
jgi:transcriptional regulator with XRE-family HTH domain